MVTFLVVEEIIDKKNMAEVHEAITLTGLFNTLVVKWDFQVVELVLVVFVKVSPYLSLGVSTWDMPHHQVSPCFISVQDSFDIDWASIVLAAARSDALL